MVLGRFFASLRMTRCFEAASFVPSAAQRQLPAQIELHGGLDLLRAETAAEEIVELGDGGLGRQVVAADSACALENMMVAANALDLGSCWINQLHWLTDHEAIHAYMTKLGLEENETVTGGLILGYGAGGAPVRGELKRTGNPVTWI